MSRTAVTIEASAGAVFDVLSDPRSFPLWVVGTKSVERADPTWPHPGARFEHRVGAGPATLHDDTRVVASRAPSILQLEVRFRPVGVAVVELEVAPIDGGRASVVCLTEVPVAGSVRVGWDGRLRRPVDGLFALRNWWSLRRLRRLVLRRVS